MISLTAQNLESSARADAAARETAGECAVGDLLSQYAARLDRGERLTNAERLRRQGLIFNHSGQCGALITTLRR